MDYQELQPLHAGPLDLGSGRRRLFLIGQFDRTFFDAELSGFDLGEVEDAVEDAEQRMAGAVDAVDYLQLVLGERFVLQQLRQAQQGRSWVCESHGSCWPGTGIWRYWSPPTVGYAPQP